MRVDIPLRHLTGRCDRDPTADLRGVLKTVKTRHHASIGYTYDAAGRRTSMTAAAQAIVDYDNANRLTLLTQGSETVTFSRMVEAMIFSSALSEVRHSILKNGFVLM